jgi:hypothetical protein
LRCSTPTQRSSSLTWPLFCSRGDGRRRPRDGMQVVHAGTEGAGTTGRRGDAVGGRWRQPVASRPACVAGTTVTRGQRSVMRLLASRRSYSSMLTLVGFRRWISASSNSNSSDTPSRSPTRTQPQPNFPVSPQRQSAAGFAAGRGCRCFVVAALSHSPEPRALALLVARCGSHAESGPIPASWSASYSRSGKARLIPRPRLRRIRPLR